MTVPTWWNRVTSFLTSRVHQSHKLYILVGNKVDIKGSHIEGKQIAKALCMDDFLKTSAKTGEGMNLAIKNNYSSVSKTAITHQLVDQENITISDNQMIKLTTKPQNS